MATGATAEAVTKNDSAQPVAEKEDSSQERELKNKRLSITSEIHNILYRAAADAKSAITKRDVEDWIEMGTSESALESGGALNEETKLKYVEEFKSPTIRFIEEAKEAGSQFLATIENAQSKKWISKTSADRWRERLKEHSGSWPETRAFLRNFNKNYVQNWENLHKDLEKIESMKKAFNINEKKVKELATLSASGFENKEYPQKRNDVSLALVALKTYIINDKKMTKLKTDAEAELRSAANERIISDYKIGPWLDHILDGKRSLEELKKFKSDWRKNKGEYDAVESSLDKLPRLPQGFTRIGEEKFLQLSYAQRVSYVLEATWRLKHHLNQPEDTPIEDLKGKIRHALDIKEWDEAEEYLKQAQKIAKGKDVYELQSLAWSLANFRTDNDEEEKETVNSEAVIKAHNEITAAIQLLPAPLKSLYVKALCRGSETFRCVRKTTGNVIWCADRGYLTEEIIEESREKAEPETYERTRPGGVGHGHGLENNLVDGFGQPAIRDKGIGPQNVHLSSGGEDAFVEKAEQNRDTYSFWYWTNLLVKGVSINQYRFVCEALHPILSKNIAILQKNGLMYSTTRPLTSVN